MRRCLSDAVAATVSSGRSVIIVTSTGEEATRYARDLGENLGVPVAVTGGEITPEERYRIHAAATSVMFPSSSVRAPRCRFRARNSASSSSVMTVMIDYVNGVSHGAIALMSLCSAAAGLHPRCR